MPPAEGTIFRIMFMCFTFVTCACFVLYSTCVRFEQVKSSEVTLWRAVDRAINIYL